MKDLYAMVNGLPEIMEQNPFLDDVASIAVIVVLGLFLFACSNWLIRKLTKRYPKYTTQLMFAKHLINALIIGFSIFNVMLQIDSLRQFALSLAASSSVVAVAVALASQEAMTNVVSGVFLSIFKPFKIGDRVKIHDKGIVGFIEEITMRHTIIRTYEHSRIIVPNSVMNSEVVENYDLSADYITSFLTIGIAYESSIDKAISIISKCAKSHPLFVDIRTPADKKDGIPAVTVKVIELGSSSVDLKISLWAKSAGEAYDLSCDLRKSIKESFDAEGIEIPYNKVVMINNNNNI